MNKSKKSQKNKKMILKNNFFKLLNNADFGRTMENVWKHRDIKLAPVERRRNYLVSEPNAHATKFFIENLLSMKMK